MLKVLHVYKTYLPEDNTGIPTVIHSLTEGLADRGVENHVMAVYNDTAAVPTRIGRHHLHPMKASFTLASSSFSLQAARDFGRIVAPFDVVTYHFPWPFADVLYFLHGQSKPSVVVYHSDIVRQRHLLRFYRFLMDAFLKSADAIVATSPDYARTSETLCRHRSKVEVIPLGIGERRPPPPVRVEEWLRCVGSDFFLFVGSARYYKGLPFLLEAARKTGLPVVIAGAVDRSELGGIPIPSHVRLVGVVSEEDKECLLELCRAFVLPSHLRSEAFGVVLLEAARAGRPMISCEIGTGTTYINLDGETGFAVPPADPARLGEAMLRLAQDDALAARLGANARARFSLFRAETMCEAYLDLYRQVLRRHRIRDRTGG
ncbi:glycosyltransferase [Aminobacter sp. J44]|uniref:glycosyltransferase n=1 Tax=Aminobacter sp. J44 TaxID=935262 RepID=UPI00119B0B28|nr:glycosyltransferase [Aminobacter sp. J44]TWG55037.1 rhamnosyl/mannosyltransferase [Aminobacter sp. J44]